MEVSQNDFCSKCAQGVREPHQSGSSWGLILHVAMDYEDDFDSINSQTVTLQFSAKHVDMDMEQSTQPIIIAHIFLDAATVWLQDRISSQIYIPDAREVWSH